MQYGGGNVSEIAKNTLEVGTNGAGEVVINHPDLEPDENGVGHIIFSVEQARNLADLLHVKAADAAVERGDFKGCVDGYANEISLPNSSVNPPDLSVEI